MNKEELTKTLGLLIKLVAIVLALVIIISFYLFFMGKISVGIFWVIVIVCAIGAYWGIPKAKKKLGELTLE